MNWFLAGLGLVGLYVALSWLHLSGAVLFSLAGITVTWFGVAFLIGAAVILKLTVLGK